MDRDIFQRRHVLAAQQHKRIPKNINNIPVAVLCEDPFMLLEKGAKSEISEIVDSCGLTPRIHFASWDDYSMISMVEHGLGVSILPELFLKRIPYRIVAKPLDVPTYREIGLALRNRKNVSLTVKRFLNY